MQDATEHVTFNRFANLFFLLYTFDYRKIEFQRTVQIRIDGTSGNGPVSPFVEGIQALHHFVRLLYLQSRSLGRRYIIYDQFVLQRHFVVIMQLMDKTADFASL